MLDLTDIYQKIEIMKKLREYDAHVNNTHDSKKQVIVYNPKKNTNTNNSMRRAAV